MQANLDTIVSKIGDTIQKEASVRAVFGEVIQLGEHRIVPVALVTMAMGGGAGGASSEKRADAGPPRHGSGFGGGGGLEVKAIPVGFIHEEAGSVRFTAIETAHDHAAKDGGGAIAKIVAALQKR